MRKILFILTTLTLYTAIGAVIFHSLEEWSWINCLYHAVIVLTTVGMAAAPENEATQLFIVIYLFFGVSIFSYSFFQLGQLVLNMELRGLWERRKMSQEIAKLRNHYIVCGLGRMGTTICEYLHHRRRPFVVIDQDDRLIEETRLTRSWLCVAGDATHDDVLKQAGIDRARALTTVLSTDADNLYVVLSARLLNEKLSIVARASDEKATTKLTRAGATRVVSPFSSGAVKIARFMLNPSVEDFLEVTNTGGGELELAEVQILSQSSYVGKQLLETDLREKGIMILGIRRSDGERLMPPPGNAIIREGDNLLVFGSAAAVNSMNGGIA